MTLADFLATWRGLTLENRLHRLAVLGLIGSSLMTAVALLRADHTVVLVPPVLEGQVSVARESASQKVKEAWALYVAELLGNVSPSSAECIQKAVDSLLAPALRRPVLEVMAAQVLEIQRERVSMSFNVRAIAYDPHTDKVFVTGVQTTSASTIRHVSAEVPVEDAPEVGEAPAATLALGPKTVRVSPGTTAIVEVAIDHLNRIVTPFTSPPVRTVSRATIQVDGNAISVATASEEPVSLFITEAGDTATAISLTLAPRHIPPREVRLALTGAPVCTGAPKIRSPRPLARNDQPYVEHIASTFRTLAQNRVPAGYELRKVGRGERLDCRQPGLSVSTAQVFDGRGLRILAAKARNRGKQPIVLEEHRCSADSGTLVAAVAAWPQSRLAPGEETELYGAVRPHEPGRERGDRPSLLGGQ